MGRLMLFFPECHGKPRVDERRVLSGIIFINRNGLRWCDAPKEYGPAKAHYNRWKRWGDKGIFARMMEGFPAAQRHCKLCTDSIFRATRRRSKNPTLPVWASKLTTKALRQKDK